MKIQNVKIIVPINLIENVVTLNELQNAQGSIFNDEALNIINKVCECIVDRIEFLKKISNLDAREDEISKKNNVNFLN
jgi:hypothetical protein